MAAHRIPAWRIRTGLRSPRLQGSDESARLASAESPAVTCKEGLRPDLGLMFMIRQLHDFYGDLGKPEGWGSGTFMLPPSRDQEGIRVTR